MRLHFVHVHEEHAQTEAESAVDRAEHEIQREDEQLRVTADTHSHQNGGQDREVVVQTDEHRVEEGEERDASELLGEDVEDQLEQPQDGDDDGENAENQLRHGQERVVFFVVEMLRAEFQIVIVQLLAFCSVLVQRLLRLLLQPALFLPSQRAALRSLRSSPCTAHTSIICVIDSPCAISSWMRTAMPFFSSLNRSFGM